MIVGFVKIPKVLTPHLLPVAKKELASNVLAVLLRQMTTHHIADMIRARVEDDLVYQTRVYVRTEYTWSAIYNRLLAPLLENA
jgi:hypothetical protein